MIEVDRTSFIKTAIKNPTAAAKTVVLSGIAIAGAVAIVAVLGIPCLIKDAIESYKEYERRCG